jgi:Leucine-rich repeat (LRR) protein
MKQYGILLSLIATTALFAQSSGDDDMAVVQTIITKCGLSSSVQDVAVVENGRVVSLDLRNKEINKDGFSFLPSEIGSLSALKVLNCSGNIIDSMPWEIGMLTDLQKLDMSSNRLVYIVSAIGKLKNLVTLDLRHNRIVELPWGIGECKKLVTLQLWGNKLTSLNDEIVSLPALEELYLNDNRLTSLPPAIMKMKLLYIDFSGNKLCSLDADLTAWAKKKDAHFTETQKCW